MIEEVEIKYRDEILDSKQKANDGGVGGGGNLRMRIRETNNENL